MRVFSDDGRCVHDAVIMRRALEYVKAFDGVIAQHAQEPRLTEDAQMNEGALSGVLGLRGWPAVAEEAIIARDVLLAEHVGSRLHVCHVSTAGSVEIIRWAKARGVDVTAEVTPHHLLLTEELVASYDPVFKVNPPLRSAERRRRAARRRSPTAPSTPSRTDHAPHPVEDKDCEWGAAAIGMLGLETALGVVAEAMVETGLLDWAGVADRMSVRPARIGRLEGHGRPLAVGEPANLVLVDPARPTTVDAHALQSRSHNTPYAGRTLPVSVVATFLRGRATVLDGAVVGRGGRRMTAITDTAPALLVLEDGTRLPRPGLRRRRRDVRRGGLHHRHVRLPGDAHRPVATTARSSCRPRRTSATTASTTTTPSRGGSGSRATSCATPPASRRTGARSARLDDDLVEQGIVGISDVDTRALTRHLRERGAMRVGVFSGEAAALPVADLLARVLASPEMAGAALADEVSVDAEDVVPAVGEKRFTVAAVDLGIKGVTPRHMAERGIEVHVLPVDDDARAAARGRASTASSSATARATRPPPTTRSRS